MKDGGLKEGIRAEATEVKNKSWLESAAGTEETLDQGRFTLRFRDVVAAERDYLERRRARNGMPDLDALPEIAGICLSGGGVRSATFNLGVLQALIATRPPAARGGDSASWMQRFDYLSTVSGGGFIGSCLTSLLTQEQEAGGEDASTKAEVELTADKSPFVGLHEEAGYKPAAKTRLSVRHQMHHLRTHGEYLVPRRRALSRDVQRAIGSVAAGLLHSTGLFVLSFVGVVAAILVLLCVFDPGLRQLLPEAAKTAAVDANVWDGELLHLPDYLIAAVSSWADQHVGVPMRLIHASVRPGLSWLGAGAAVGALWCALWLTFAVPRCLRLQDRDAYRPPASTRSGWTGEDEHEARFVRRFNLWSVVLALALAVALGAYQVGHLGEPHFLVGAWLPAAFALGGLLLTHLWTQIEESFRELRPDRQGRLRRSLFGSLQGAATWGFVVAWLAPPLLVVLLALGEMPISFLALVFLVVGYRASRQAGDSPVRRRLSTQHLHWIATLGMVLFLTLLFAGTSSKLVAALGRDELEAWLVGIAFAALGSFLFFSNLIDPNRVSLHYFYRDRLSEAYLRTYARFRRSEEGAHQGMPLRVLRDDTELKLCQLGDGHRGPYHLIVAALNLRGSDELNRKTFLSEHFLFSRDYVGSRVTGYVRTPTYRRGETKLARAMTISAAAVGSAIGRHSFLAQAFFTTLFNARLGYWMENPWFYRGGGQPEKPVTSWSWYFLLEMFGVTTARERLVNLSDGGHTGDNLGLMPLLDRRCSLVVVCDAEADEDYAFKSFNNALRMAFVEQNIRIDIDLTPIRRCCEADGFGLLNERGVVEGRIYYPRTEHQAASEGRLLYVKASVPQALAAQEEEDCDDPQQAAERVPVQVLSFRQLFPAFPHQGTVDQQFNDAQFEAYRALGAYVGGHLCRAL